MMQTVTCFGLYLLFVFFEHAVSYKVSASENLALVRGRGRVAHWVPSLRLSRRKDYTTNILPVGPLHRKKLLRHECCENGIGNRDCR